MNPAPCLPPTLTGEAPAGIWTGWIEADLFSCTGDSRVDSRAGAIAITGVEISLRLDVITLWIGSRTLAVADRDAVRAWVASPFQPLQVDDVEFVLVEGQLCLRIDGAGPFALSAEAVRLLVEALQP